MLLLNILDNETILIIAEILFIVIGSMLLGILLSYLYSSGAKRKLSDLALAVDEEKKQSEELRDQVQQISDIRARLQSELTDLQDKANEQAKTIHDQQKYIYAHEAEHKNQKATIDGLNATIDSYQHRLRIIESELEQTKIPEPKPKKAVHSTPQRINFEHVSKLLGKNVTENDLTLIVGIGPKTAALLHSNGIETWEQLSATSQDSLRNWLIGAGGIYKSQDPTHWPKQAVMAAQGEWRKLRVFQETLQKTE